MGGGWVGGGWFNKTRTPHLRCGEKDIHINIYIYILKIIEHVRIVLRRL